MLIRSGRNWKDGVRGKLHHGITRRDLLRDGLLTATATAFLPGSLLDLLVNRANAASTCPPLTRQPGALVQIFREGGPCLGASLLNSIQAQGMTAAAAANYGILGATDLVQGGPNWFVAKSSPFGAAVLTPPPGYTASAWASVLNRSSLGGHYGPFFADDGGGSDLGQLGAASAFKSSMLGTDLRIHNGVAKAIWAQGAPASSIGQDTDEPTSNFVPTTLQNVFAMTPANGITPQVMTNSAIAADSLGSIFANVFNLAARKFGIQSLTNAACGFYGDSVLATPNLGKSLFDPTQIAALSTATIQVASLSLNQQALFSSFYQSAIGSVGGVIIQQGGGDYHNDFDVQFYTDNVAPNDYEAGVYVAMFLAACDAAKAPGAMIINSNGNCGGDGVTQVTINGTQNVMSPITSGGDTGGFLNGGLILCYSPTTPPVLKTTGTFKMVDGSVTAAANVFSVPAGLAGCYLTAFNYLGLNVNAATAAMQAAGINNPTSLLLI